MNIDATTFMGYAYTNTNTRTTASQTNERADKGAGRGSIFEKQCTKVRALRKTVDT